MTLNDLEGHFSCQKPVESIILDSVASPRY